MAVTKSGTNRFRGSVYNVRRNSDWNANSKANELNGVPKAVSKAQDIGFSIGGPIGKPGGSNKLFFFFAEEFNPATAGGTQQTFRLPTALERQGDFSQSSDNLGNLYPYIKDPLLSGACTAADQAACFRDGGVARQDSPGSAVFAGPEHPEDVSDAEQPEHDDRHQPSVHPADLRHAAVSAGAALRLPDDARPAVSASSTRATTTRSAPRSGSLPGWNDTIVPIPEKGTEVVTVNYNISSTTFLEGTYGRAGNQLAGCGGLSINDVSDSRVTGLANLPLIFPEANVINPDYYAYEILNFQNPPYWDGTRIYKVPAFQWGNRVTAATPNVGPPTSSTPASSTSTRRRTSRSTSRTFAAVTRLKAGYYNNHSLKRENNVLGGTNFGTINFSQDTVGVNPFDTSFGFANAAIGSFSSFVQASKYVEGKFNYDNREAYVQDSWKVKSNWSIDYGLRFVHATPQHDKLLQSGNFLPDKWVASAAPGLYVPACANAAATCTGSNRAARNPLTGQILGPNTSLAIGTLVPNSGQERNGLFQSGKEIAEYDL